MQCEVCGKETGSAKKILLDGIEMLACKECARFGLEAEKPKPAGKIDFEEKEIEKAGSFDLALDLKKGFGRIISCARQKQGLTLEELGKKIFEPASLLKRTESEHLKPSDALIKKLEKALQVKLKEKIEE
ncbi:MAG: multiprotein-bridging factor 1 family protein [Candidatus ainarchaeum sp.]|nr:multiprotein-bridging factor 1 family protein [Candidatus ainarchaeum sp.]